jgi:hypothetical protein
MGPRVRRGRGRYQAAGAFNNPGLMHAANMVTAGGGTPKATIVATAGVQIRLASWTVSIC